MSAGPALRVMVGCANCGVIFEFDRRAQVVRCDACRQLDDGVLVLVDRDGMAELEAACDYCRLEWPLDDLEEVVWTDTAGEEWERRFCSSCRDRLGL